VGYDAALLSLTVRAMRIYSVSFLLSGIAIFGSCFFTALNDGVSTAIISFMRTLVFQSAAVMLMPLVWGLDGIWWSVVGCEGMAMAVSLFFFCHHRHKFHYA
jgi:Na+-driven multidrug efflux pump